MHTEAVGVDPAGNRVRNRIRFFAIEADRFAWESQVSLDEGKTWVKVATLTATRKDSPTG